MNRIEFIGASGTGKTYLLNQVLLKRTAHDQWVTPKEARIQIVKNLKHCYQIDTQSLKIAFIKMGALKNMQDVLTISVLGKYKNSVIKKCLADYDGLIDLFYYSLMASPYLTPTKKIWLSSLYFNLLINDVLYLDYFGITETIVYDDGIIHNNAGINDWKKYQEKICVDTKIYNKVTPKRVIYCKLGLEDNVKRRKKRTAEERRATILEDGLNDKELQELYERSLITAEKKIAVMKSAQVPVLEIDMARDQNENVEAILRFIKTV